MVFLLLKVKFKPLLFAYSFFYQYLLLEKKQFQPISFFWQCIVKNISKKVILENNPIKNILIFKNQHSKYQYIFFQKQNYKII
ncbi:hypothetical protein EGI22_19810 [Lacihabitans sp. LS3-19]|nr:hypothetical protein [Lacihabitans sp. LS3-19]